MNKSIYAKDSVFTVLITNGQSIAKYASGHERVGN